MTDSPRDGTTVALRDYVDRRFEDTIGHLEAKFRTLEEALTTFKRELQLRLDTMNEIRQQLNAQQNTFVTISTFDAKMEGLGGRLDNLGARIDSLLAPLNSRVNALERSSGEKDGRNRTLTGLTAAVIGVVGTLIVGLAALIVRLLMK
jgi:tetrahydromethanopterin S-methyltransferase subunit B